MTTLTSAMLLKNKLPESSRSPAEPSLMTTISFEELHFGGCVDYHYALTMPMLAVVVEVIACSLITSICAVALQAPGFWYLVFLEADVLPHCPRFLEHPCPNHINIRVPSVHGDESTHAQTRITFVFQAHTLGKKFLAHYFSCKTQRHVMISCRLHTIWTAVVAFPNRNLINFHL